MRDLFNGDVEDSDNLGLNIMKYYITPTKTETISGVINGSKSDSRTYNSYGSNLNSNFKSNLKRSDRLNFIEYGATIGYSRPKIKKGIDYNHNPKVQFEKYDSNDSNIFSKPYVTAPVLGFTKISLASLMVI